MDNFPYAFGVIPSNIDLRDYRYSTTINQAYQYTPWDSLPTFELENMPPIKSQGSVGSCVAHAASSIIEWCNYQEKQRHDKMSTMWIYGDRNNSNHKGTGMIIRDMLKNLMNRGIIAEGALPGNKEVPEALDIFNTYYEDFKHSAQLNRIKGYFALKDVSELKSALYNCGPVLISIKWYKNSKVKLMLPKGKFLTVDYENAGKYQGSHALVIYGWNEKGWLIQNSWGVEWGDEGRAVLDYNYVLDEIWGIEDDHSGIPLYELNMKKEIDKLTQEKENLTNTFNSKVANYTKEINSLNDIITDKTNQLLSTEAHFVELEQLKNEAKRKAEEATARAEKAETAEKIANEAKKKEEEKNQELLDRFSTIKTNLEGYAATATMTIEALSEAFKRVLINTDNAELCEEMIERYKSEVNLAKKEIEDISPIYSDYVRKFIWSNEEMLREIEESRKLEEKIADCMKQAETCPYTIIKKKYPVIGKWILKLANWILNKMKKKKA